MSLAEDAKRYIAFKQALGLKFESQGRVLRRFADFSQERGERFIRRMTVLDWTGTAPSVTGKRQRLRCIHGFAVWINGEDSRHEIPDPTAFGRGCRRSAPHLPTIRDIRAIMAAALELGPPGSINPHSIHTMIGLIATTGLRRSEAVNLQLTDYTADGLVVRNSKFGKSRLVPLHASTRAALDAFLDIRQAKGGANDHLFVNSAGHPFHPSHVTAVFIRLARQTGLRRNAGTGGLRLHDLRHAFAVRSFESMPATADAGRHALALSTYMGHASIECTYCYAVLGMTVNDRDRGAPRGATPPTPPGIRVRTTAVRPD